MNKYQEAFNRLKNDIERGNCDYNVEPYLLLLQEAVDKAIKYDNKNTTLKAINVRSTWDEDNDYLIGTCPVCKHTNEATTVWATDTTKKCSYCGQKLLFSLRK